MERQWRAEWNQRVARRNYYNEKPGTQQHNSRRLGGKPEKGEFAPNSSSSPGPKSLRFSFTAWASKPQKYWVNSLTVLRLFCLLAYLCFGSRFSVRVGWSTEGWTLSSLQDQTFLLCFMKPQSSPRGDETNTESEKNKIKRNKADDEAGIFNLGPRSPWLHQP